ncbi:TetR/AcrR family transcriptional regulator, partial [Actinocatenispora thailandica]
MDAATRGRDVRQRLLAAAVELIPERGWTAVSTRVLAERAGVTPSVVHYHFPSVSALLDEAVVGFMREVVAGIDEVLAAADSPAAAVDAMVASVARYTGSDPLSLLAVEACLAATRDDRLRDQIAAVLAESRHRVGRWLAAHDVPDPETTAAMLLAAVDGLLLHRSLAAGP